MKLYVVHMDASCCWLLKRGCIPAWLRPGCILYCPPAPSWQHQHQHSCQPHTQLPVTPCAELLELHTGLTFVLPTVPPAPRIRTAYMLYCLPIVLPHSKDSTASLPATWSLPVHSSIFCMLYCLPIVPPCSKDSTSVTACYLELAEKVRAGLGHIDPYFAKLADGMVAWIETWQALNPDYEK